MYESILILHILAATVWTGGHLVLTLSILPGALMHRDADRIIRFESVYERIGLPALVTQVISGLWLTHRFFPDAFDWFTLENPLSRLIVFKLTLLAMTAVLAVDARLRLIPHLTNRNLTALAWHIVPVTVISVLFVVVGVAFRFGGVGG